jgi:hypothetical protein
MKCYPKELNPPTDIFRQRINLLYSDMNTVDTFLDNTMILGYGTFDDHLKDVTEVLKRLLVTGMQVNMENACGSITLSLT